MMVMSESPLSPDEMVEVLLSHADNDERIRVVDAVDILHMHNQAARKGGSV